MLDKKTLTRNNRYNKEGLKERASCEYPRQRISRFIQPCLLLLLSQRHSYGYELIEKLKLFGFQKEKIDVGAVYRTLHSLEKEGFVKSQWQTKQRGAAKKYYKITKRGRLLLKAWVDKIKQRREALSRFLEEYDKGSLR